MRFFDRFITLARADAHGVLDSLEDSGLVLKQCLRDAENELISNRSRADELMRWLEQLTKEREILAIRADTLDDEIRLAITEDAEELARFSIRRLLAARHKREGLEEQLQIAAEELSGLEARIAKQDAELSELRQQVEAHLSRERAAEAGCRSSQLDCEADPFVREEEVELELLRRRQQGACEEVAQ